MLLSLKITIAFGAGMRCCVAARAADAERAAAQLPGEPQLVTIAAARFNIVRRGSSRAAGGLSTRPLSQAQGQRRSR